MKFKARIKSMSIEKKAKNISQVVFEPLDRTMVCNEPHYLAIDSGKVVELPMSACSVNIDNDLFVFLSQHSKEEFVIEIDKHNNDADDNLNNVTCDNEYCVIKIELIYG